MQERTEGQELVSIIVPVYNVEEYLDKAVQSAVSQTYTNLEIILVDDGARDNSGRMCDQWRERDARIRVIHKPNGGLSNARNAALDVCRGDYIYFFDSDDYIAEDTIEVMLADARRFDADLVEAAVNYVYPDRCVPRGTEGETRVMTTVEAIRYDMGGRGGAMSATSKLYRRFLFQTCRFREGKLHEDMFAYMELISGARVIVFEPRPLYNYYRRKAAITTSSFSERSLDAVEAARYNLEIIEAKYPEAREVGEFQVYYWTFKLIDKIMLGADWRENRHLAGLLDYVRAHRAQIMKNAYVVPTRKMAARIMLLNLPLYHYVVRRQAKKYGLT